MALSSVFSTSSAAAQNVPVSEMKKRPNIVLIMVDDMGFSDLGCYGGEIATPNLDRLAAGGMRFTQFYNAARCCPSRAALLTGLQPHQAGVGSMVEDYGHPAYQGFLNEKCVTVAEVLRQSGYRTLMSGKWHVGEKRPHWPTDRGFDRYYGLISGASSYFKMDANRQMALDDQPITPPENDFYMTDAFTDNAVKFLDENGRREQPFFLYLAYTAPHYPLHARPEEIARYRGRYQKGWDALRRERHARQLEMGIVDAKWPLSPRDPAAPAWEDAKNRDEWDLRMSVYAAQVEAMDRGVGQVLQKIEALGETQNTLVMFLSDNGASPEAPDLKPAFTLDTPGATIGSKESWTTYRTPWANVSNTPFRDFKRYTWEGGIATPLIVSWPGTLKPSGLNHSMGHITDLMPTCLDAAGATYPATFEGRAILPTEAKSLLPLLKGEKWAGRDTLCWEHGGSRAVRQGKWKLVSGTSDGAWELYDVEADRTELVNLAAKQPQKVREMAALHDNWAARNGVVPWHELQKQRAAQGAENRVAPVKK